MKRLAAATLLALTVLGADAVAQPRRNPPAPPPAPVAAEQWREVSAENTLLIETTQGLLAVEMVPEIAPRTVAHIKVLVRQGFYDRSQFYRVVPAFVAQFGDRGERRYASGAPKLPGEFTFTPPGGTAPPPPLTPGLPEPRFIASVPYEAPPSAVGQAHPKFCTGVAGMAHGADPNSGESQVYFLMGSASNLERAFTAWGRLLVGEDILRRLAVGEPPASPDTIVRARVAADIPEAERHVLEVWETSGPRWAQHLQAIARAGPILSACQVPLPARLRAPGTNVTR